MNASLREACNGPALPLIIPVPVSFIPIASRRAGLASARFFMLSRPRCLMPTILLFSTPEGASITFIPGP